jgi:NIPSNAP
VIYEIRTYRLKPGSLAEVEKRFGEAYEVRKKHSELVAFLHTEIGPLNEIVHIWPYPDLNERARVRAGLAKETGWPPKIQEFIVNMKSEILVPFPFSPELKPGKLGPIYEMRCYDIAAGSLPGIMQRWEAKLPGRQKFSPLAVVGHVDIGPANRFIHIWPYPSLQARTDTRKQAVEAGAWPPGSGPDTLLAQENKILLPAAFSPMQ